MTEEQIMLTLRAPVRFDAGLCRMCMGARFGAQVFA
jgi:hypothetical protein